MDVIIESKKFYNPSLGEPIGKATSWPYANRGDVEVIEYGIRYDGSYLIVTSITPNDGDVYLAANPGSNLTQLDRDSRILWTDNPIGFEGYEEGDVVTIDRVASSNIVRTVLEKIDNQTLLMSVEYTAQGGGIMEFALNTKVYNSTKIESLEVFHNWIENDEPVNYIDKTTFITRKAVVDNLDNTVLTETPMIQVGDEPYKFGSLSVRGNGIGEGNPSSAYSQAFVITITTLVSPLSTPQEINNEKQRISPIYFKDNASLKHVFRVEAGSDLTNPNRRRIAETVETRGNVGDDNESGNTGSTNYFTENVVYRNAASEIIERLELTTDVQTIEFDYRNTATSPFVSGQTKFIFKHWYMHLSQDELSVPEFPDPNEPYPSRDRTLKQNQLFDEIICTSNVLNTSSENTGTDYQIIKQCIGTHVSTSKIHVVVDVQLALDAVTRISPLTGKDYRISISGKDFAKTRAKAEKANVDVDINQYFIDETDPSMITTVIDFMDHTGSDPDTDSEASLIVRKNDEVLARASFVIDHNDITGFDRLGVAIGLSSAKIQVIAKNGSKSFVLDEYTTSLSPDNTFILEPYGAVPILDITEDRGFTSPSDEQRTNVRLRRRIDLDIDDTGLFNYEITFPFYFQTDDFIENQNVVDEFRDESLPFNGKNNDWFRFFDGTDWNMFVRVEIIATKDGVPLAPFVTNALLLTRDYDAGTEWDDLGAKTYLASTGDEIVNGGQHGVSLDENALIKWDQLFNTTPLPTLPDLVFVITLKLFENGDYKTAFRLSSLHAITVNSNILIGLTDDFVTKSIITTTTFRGSLFIKPPEPNQSYETTYRIYDTRPDLGVPNGMATEDAILMATENGIIMNVETL